MGSQPSKPPHRPALSSSSPEHTKHEDDDSLSTEGIQQFTAVDADWPYVWAIREYRVLDWHHACPTPDLQQECMLAQLQLPVEILPKRLYLGDYACVRNRRLQTLGVTGILNLTPQAHSAATVRALREAGIQVVHVPTLDQPEYPLLALHWEEILHALQDMMLHNAASAVVVHCHQGRNRAALVVAAYLVVERGYTVLEAVRWIRRQRGNTALATNRGFQEQLVALARQCDRLGAAPGAAGSIVRQRPSSLHNPEPWMTPRMPTTAIRGPAKWRQQLVGFMGTTSTTATTGGRR